MAELPTPSASRLRRPSWRDGRLLVGLVLVLLSAALGSLALARADDRLPVYAARGPLLPGQALSAERVSRVDVQLAEAMPGYLSAAGELPPNTFVLREIRDGELVPLSALGGADQVSVQPLTLLADATSVSALVVGSVVDVYVNPPVEGATGRAFQGPRLALRGVSVARLPRSSTVLGSATDATDAVQVMAPGDQVKDLIAQVDTGAKVTLVPVPGSVVRTDR